MIDYETVWKLLDDLTADNVAKLPNSLRRYVSLKSRRESNGNLENSENIQSPQSAARGGGAGGGAGELLGKEHYAN